MKIVSRDYSIGQNTVQSKNETAKMSLYPKSYATQSQINANTNLANTISTISNVANTAYNTYEKINDINTKENEAQIEASGIYHNAVQALNSSATALNSNGQEEYTTWVNNPDGTRTPSASHRAVIDSFISEINNGSYTNDAKKYAINKLEGLYNDNVSSFSAKATQENIAMQNKQWNDNLDSAISQRANAIQTGNADEVYKATMNMFDIIGKKYTGKGGEYARQAAIKQSDIQAAYLEGDGILKSQGYTAMRDFYTNLGKTGAFTQEQVDTGIARGTKTLSELNKVVTEKGTRDTIDALKAGGDPTIARNKIEQECKEQGFSQQLIDTAMASSIVAQKGYLEEQFADFKTKVANCKTTEELTLIGNDLAVKYPAFQGCEDYYNTLSSLVTGKFDGLNTDITNYVGDQIKLVKANVIGYPTARENIMKMLDTNKDGQTDNGIDIGTLAYAYTELDKLYYGGAQESVVLKGEYNNCIELGRAYAQDQKNWTNEQKKQFEIGLEKYLDGIFLTTDKDENGTDRVRQPEDITKAYETYKEVFGKAIVSGAGFTFGLNSAGWSNTTGNYKQVPEIVNQAYSNTLGAVITSDVNGQSTIQVAGMTNEEFNKNAVLIGSYMQDNLKSDIKFVDPETNSVIVVGLANGAEGKTCAMPILLSIDGMYQATISADGTINPETSVFANMMDIPEVQNRLVKVTMPKAVKGTDTQQEKNNFYAGVPSVASDINSPSLLKDYVEKGVEDKTITRDEADSIYFKHKDNMETVVNSTDTIKQQFIDSLKSPELSRTEYMYMINDGVTNGIITEAEAKEYRRSYKRVK